MVNLLATQKREHSQKPDELYDVVERCSFSPYIELFARNPRPGWVQWGNEVEQDARYISRPALARKRTVGHHLAA